ncbi:hypothetical protein P3W45_000961 [Vairimorpha bombi]|jgi:ubiquilin
MKIKITIRHLSSNYTLEINKSDTLEHLKDRIYSILKIDPTLQILLYNDRQLTENHRNLHELNIDENSVIFLKKKNLVTIKPNTQEKKSSSNKNPMLESILKNPDYMKNVMEMMPQMKEEMEDNPQLKAMMNSATFQEEMVNLSGDPNYLKEQMKNFDLTVSKLENMPGGFNMINSMMKDVQDPLVSAFTDNIGNNKYKEGEKISEINSVPIPGSRRESSVSLLVKYREELALLRAMGFDNSKNNLSALVACNGDVDETIEHLKSKTG